VGQSDQGTDHGHDFRPGVQFADKAAVHFQRVKGQAGQITQAGITSTKIVDHQADAEVLEALHGLSRTRNSVQHHRFRKFDLQKLWRQTGVLQSADDFVDETVTTELQAGNVHRNLNGMRCDGLPFESFGAGHLHDVSAQRNDQPALLGHRDELGGSYHAERGMGPAGQSLEAKQAMGGDIVFRLILHVNLASRNGVAQLIFQIQAFAHQRAKLRSKVHGAVFAIALGGIHGAVGLLQQVGVIGGVVGENTDADAGADGDFVVPNLKRSSQNIQQTLGNSVRVFPGADVGQNHRELVASEAGEGIRLANPGAQTGRNLNQKEIADRVTETVVDQLETIQIDVHERDQLAFASGHGQNLGETVGKQPAIG